MIREKNCNLRGKLLTLVEIIDINNEQNDVAHLDWLVKSEVVHRQLRSELPADYVGKMKRVFSDGARMSIAVINNVVIGVAVYRVYENTSSGVHMYVDDLVVDETKRSNGIGKLLLDHLQTFAQLQKCESFNLDSGTHRHLAHKFYFSEGMAIVAFHLIKKLSQSAL